MDKFILQVPKPKVSGITGVIRVSPSCYQSLWDAKARTGIPIGVIAEKCVAFALERLEVEGVQTDAG